MSEEIIRIKKERPVTKIAYFTNVIISNNELIDKGISLKNNWDLIVNNGTEAYGLIGPANKIIELVGDLPRIELFARQKTEGWDAWGNEV
jgi:N6-adenosine-specific RNA methylase IME4